MDKIKRQKRGKKHEYPDFLPPVHDNPENVQEMEESRHPATIQDEEGQQQIKAILIPKETIFVEEGRFEKPHFIMQTILSSLGLLALIGFVVFSLLQHADSGDALKLAKSGADSAGARSRESIDLARESMHMIEQNASRREEIARMEVRSYLGIVEPFMIEFVSGKSTVIAVECQNMGKTPARKIRFSGGMKIGGKRISTREIKSSLRDFVVPCGVISPGAKYVQTIPSLFVLTKTDSTNIMDGSRNLFIFGELTYVDIFDSPHLARFCMKYQVPLESFFVEGAYNDAN